MTNEENKRILRKIDLTILPIMLAVYFLQALEKATLSYASVFGLVTDAHLGGQDYSWLGSIVYVAQLVLQPVIAYFLVKLPTGKFAAVMILCWGAVLSFMALAKSFQGLLATRFFLGAFEAAVGKPNMIPTQR
jgi:MFS family permease